MTTTATHSAVRIEPAYDDPDAALAVIRSVDEYWPIARYAPSIEELEATGGKGVTDYVPPWFRTDLALEGAAQAPGAELFLHNPRFVRAAHEVFGTEATVTPTTVYVNVMLPSVVPFIPHLDVAEFRGVTRRDHPVWLLKAMFESGLFEPWRVKLATAVSWFYEGPGGEFHYWPAGPDGPSERIDPPMRNVAVVADNERTYHGVGQVGGPDVPFVEGLTRESSLRRVAGGWEMFEAGRSLGGASDDAVRITVSWKAQVRTPDDRDDDELTLSEVVDTILADLRSRGVEVAAPDDPHHDREWIRTVAAAYPPQAPRIPR